MSVGIERQAEDQQCAVTAQLAQLCDRIHQSTTLLVVGDMYQLKPIPASITAETVQAKPRDSS